MSPTSRDTIHEGLWLLEKLNGAKWDIWLRTLINLQKKWMVSVIFGGGYCACARLQGESDFNYFKSRCRTASMNTKLREGSSLYCSFLHKTRNYAIPRAIFDSPTPIIRKAKTCKLVAKTQETQKVLTQSRGGKGAEQWIYGLRGGLSWTTTSLPKHDWNWQAIRSRSDALSNLKQLVSSALRLWAGQFCTTMREMRRRWRPWRSIAINGSTKWQQGSTQPQAVSSEAKSIGRTNSCNILQPDTSDFYFSSHIR